MNYKITFHFTAPVSFIDKPIFDSILAYCYAKDLLDNVPQYLNIEKEQMIDFSPMPIIQHEQGYFMGSWLMFEDVSETYTKVRKKWENKFDFLADFEGNKRKVCVSRGAYKSYDLQINLHHIKEGCFFFQSNDLQEVRRLIDSYLVGIGKKVGYGYGRFSHYEIESLDYNPFEKEIIRPIPANENDLLRPNAKFRIMSWKPPYWLPHHQTLCLVP